MTLAHHASRLLLAALVLLPVVSGTCFPTREAGAGTPACTALPAQVCYGIRPGALFHAQNWTDCTANFVFVSPSGVFTATAAHCVNKLGDGIWFYYPNASSPASTTYTDMESRPPDGRVAFIAPEWNPAGDFRRDQDFALIRLNESVLGDVAPEVCGGRGPTGIYEEVGAKQYVLYFYGHGVGFNGAMEARQGIGPTWDGGPLFYATATLSDGDSGGPWLTHDGLAIGHESGGTPPAQSANGSEVGVHLKAVLAAAKASGLPLRLVMAGQDPRAEYAKEREAARDASGDPSPRPPAGVVPTAPETRPTPSLVIEPRKETPGLGMAVPIAWLAAALLRRSRRMARPSSRCPGWA